MHQLEVTLTVFPLAHKFKTLLYFTWEILFNDSAASLFIYANNH